MPTDVVFATMPPTGPVTDVSKTPLMYSRISPSPPCATRSYVTATCIQVSPSAGYIALEFTRNVSPEVAWLKRAKTRCGFAAVLADKDN
jgi:hypothetical protein